MGVLLKTALLVEIYFGASDSNFQLFKRVQHLLAGSGPLGFSQSGAALERVESSENGYCSMCGRTCRQRRRILIGQHEGACSSEL